VQRNVSDNPPTAIGDPGDDEPSRDKEVGDVRLQDKRVPIDVVNHPDELNTALQVDVVTNPDLDTAVGDWIAHRSRIACLFSPSRHTATQSFTSTARYCSEEAVSTSNDDVPCGPAR
jgi:hypothetical protein